jgi:neutral ceramidase
MKDSPLAMEAPAEGPYLAMLLVAAILAGCAGFEPMVLPSPRSGPPLPRTDTLRAGVSRVDITPPAGFGLFGYGSEGKLARGYRNRLYARALVLEGANGEAIAFAVVDLGVGSSILHRNVAARVLAATDSAIGADRLILSMTHTHSGPGHFLAAWPLNVLGSGEAMGYDPELVNWLSERIAAAVTEAYDSRRPAKAAWSVANIWGHTRNRMYRPYLSNSNVPAYHIPPPAFSLDELRRAVNPRWAFLRVDIEDSPGRYLPAGAFSVFAIHGTGYPAANDLYDSDIHGIVARKVERYLDSLRGRPGAVHLLANSTEGDVSPNWPPDARCDLASVRLARRPGGPRTPNGKEDWADPLPERIAACLAAAKNFVRFTGRALADSAMRMFRSLEPHLESQVSIHRAFKTVHLTDGAATQAGLCKRGKAGIAIAAGGDDGLSRFNGWRVLGLLPLIEAGGYAVDSGSTDCQRPKRILFPPLQSRLVGRFQFPETTQLAVVRIGDLVLGTVPGEVTTTAGLRMMAAMQHAIPDSLPAGNIAIMGLANGDLRYITTAEEFQSQTYEGASNLYGPHTASFLGSYLGTLTRTLFHAPDGRLNPIVYVGPITVRPGPASSLWPDRTARPDTLGFERPPACEGGTVVLRWYDAAPGAMLPAGKRVVTFRRERTGQEVWDDDTEVEVRALKKHKQGYLWEVRWTPVSPALIAGDSVTITLERWSNNLETVPPVNVRC